MNDYQRLGLRVSVCLSVGRYVCLSFLSASLPACLPACLPASLPACMSICQSVCQDTCLTDLILLDPDPESPEPGKLSDKVRPPGERHEDS